MKITNKKIITIATGLALALSAGLPAFAETNSQGDGGWQGQGKSAEAPGHMRDEMGMRNQDGSRSGVGGIVTAISGTTITISSHYGLGPTASATTTYTVNASNATVRKNNATSTISSIVVGDRLFVQGTVTGTTVVATSIVDGIGPVGDRGPGMMDRNGYSSSTPPFVGNGQPVVAGTVSAINGTALTITTASNVTYTVDASSAKIVQGKETVALSNIAVGENVLIQGTVNGTSVTATTIVDQRAPVQGSNPRQNLGFFGGIGNFFKHLFGF